MYVITHDYQFSDERAHIHTLRCEFTGETLVNGILDCDERLCGAFVRDKLHQRDWTDVFGVVEQDVTLERFATLVYAALHACAPLLTAVTVVNHGDEFERRDPGAPGTSTRERVTYRPGPCISDVAKLRAALASLGYDVDRENGATVDVCDAHGKRSCWACKHNVASPGSLRLPSPVADALLDLPHPNTETLGAVVRAADGVAYELRERTDRVRYWRPLSSTSAKMFGAPTCEKRPHNDPSAGYLHDEDDDSPYDVDGVSYCGRCHVALPHDAARVAVRTQENPREQRSSLASDGGNLSSQAYFAAARDRVNARPEHLRAEPDD